MTYLTERLSCKVIEIPIYFEDAASANRMSVPSSCKERWMSRIWWRHSHHRSCARKQRESK